VNHSFPPKNQLKTKAINQMRADYFYSSSPQTSKPKRYAVISLHTYGFFWCQARVTSELLAKD